MKAIVCSQLSGVDCLEYIEVPAQTLLMGEVGVAVCYVALNFYDTLIVQGKYQVKPALPFSPGGEFCGVVTRVAPDVTDIIIGQRVVGLVSHGALREEIVVCATSLTTCSPELAPEMAACLPIAYGTALHALRDRGRIKKGETLVILGAGGGTGLAAVEVGKALGARVIACASTVEKCTMAQTKGADETLLMPSGKEGNPINLKRALKSMCGEQGVDVIFDPVGADLSEQAIRALSWGGRYLIVGFAGGNIPSIPLNIPLLKGVDLCGIHLGGFQKHEPKAHQANMMTLLNWAREKKLNPHIETMIPLSQTKEGLHLIANRKVTGKVVVKIV